MRDDEEPPFFRMYKKRIHPLFGMILDYKYLCTMILNFYIYGKQENDR